MLWNVVNKFPKLSDIYFTIITNYCKVPPERCARLIDAAQVCGSSSILLGSRSRWRLLPERKKNPRSSRATFTTHLSQSQSFDKVKLFCVQVRSSRVVNGTPQWLYFGWFELHARRIPAKVRKGSESATLDECVIVWNLPDTVVLRLKACVPHKFQFPIIDN